ncbi:MAG: pyridoxal-phosphate dependent enzyme [Gammaproteobacteria bacterium]
MFEILTQGDPRLERPSQPVQWPDTDLQAQLDALHEALADFRQRKGFGRAIAAPQIGIGKRFIALNLGATPFALINPQISWRSEAQFEVWDDCLSVPESVVRVARHESISVHYLDEQGRPRFWPELPPDLSELVQHEIDHLDGVLMTERAVDEHSIRPIAEHAELVGSSRPVHRLSLQSIAQAWRVIDPVFVRSPQYECEPLSQALGCKLTLKAETLNPLRSFKGRGADYFVARATARGDERAIVCASAGNFGQALAYACAKHRRKITVYAAAGANPLKVERMLALGADVRLEGEDFDMAKAAARRHAGDQGAWMVEDGLEPEISEGAGTIGLELLRRADAFDAVTVPLGNGALLNGIARWLKAAAPATRVLGVCAEGADAMQKSWRTGSAVTGTSANTIADGIAVRVPVVESVDDMRGQVDDVVLVNDDTIVEAMRALYRHAGLLIEPAGAAGVAAVLADRDRFEGKHVATVLCGSNLTQAQIGQWLSTSRR